MFEVQDYEGLPKPELYARLHEQAQALFTDEPDAIANAANAAALLWTALPTINWAGFYILREGELVLGPFQGKPACVRIALGKGVCGTAARDRETQRVGDVHTFPGHIACDAASRSEIVVPILGKGADWEGGAAKGEPALWGVLDIDSPEPGRFDADDQVGLEAFVEIYCQASELSGSSRA